MEEVGGPFGPASAGGALVGGEVVELASFAEDGGADADGGKGDEQDDQKYGEAGGETGAAEVTVDAVVEGVEEDRERDGGDERHEKWLKNRERDGDGGRAEQEEEAVLDASGRNRSHRGKRTTNGWSAI